MDSLRAILNAKKNRPTPAPCEAKSESSSTDIEDGCESENEILIKNSEVANTEVRSHRMINKPNTKLGPTSAPKSRYRDMKMNPA